MKNKSSAFARSVGRIFRKPSLLLAAAWAVGMIHYGSTKGWVHVYNVHSDARYLTDNGSFTTNDYVRINLTRSALMPDTADFYVYRRLWNQTNDADWVEVVSTNIGSVSFPLTIPFPGANTNDWLTGTSYVRSPTYTNKVAVIIWAPISEGAASAAPISGGEGVAPRASPAGLVPIRTGVYYGPNRLFPKLTTESQSDEN